MKIKLTSLSKAFWSIICGEKLQTIDRMLGRLKDFDLMINESEEARVFLKSPKVSFRKKAEFIIEITKKLNYEGEVILFLVLILKRNFLYALLKIIEHLIVLRNEDFKIMSLNVRAVSPLNKAQKEELDEIMKNKFTVKRVEIDEKIDEKLLGGLVLSFMGNVIDGSLKRKIQIINKTLQS